MDEKYSSTILTDDNFDKELEKLCELVGLPYSSCNSFVEALDDDFTVQINNGKEEWVRTAHYPNINPDYNIFQAFEKGQLAYEFGNGFIILDFEELLG